jgi:hypothetical protein
MEQPILYASQYNGADDYITQTDNGERWLHIYQGIYQHIATRGNGIYPVVKFLGSVNITHRRFYKGAKHPRKITRQEGESIFINDNEYKPLNILFAENGYPEDLLNNIQNLIITQSNNPNLKTNNSNRIGGENEGIYNF